MTVWIMPEFDREGRAVCQFWFQGGKPQWDSHRQNSPGESPLGISGPPPLFREKGGDSKFPESLRKKTSTQRN